MEGDRKYSYKLNLLNGPLVRWDKSKEGFLLKKKKKHNCIMILYEKENIC